MHASTSYREWDRDSVNPTLADPFFLDHVARYYHALKHLHASDRVLDVACGKGYGSALLATRAGQVTGIDLNAGSLSFAREHYGRQNLDFRKLDVLEAPRLEARFDVITAFEIIEHISPRQTEPFLHAIRQSLRPGGKLLISTPNHDVVTKAGVEVPPFHINNFTAAELRAVLKIYFPRVALYGQFRSRGPLVDTLLHLDVLSLRHALPRRTPVAAGPESAKLLGELWTPDTRPPGIEAYRFSRLVAQQAGLTFAVCSN